MPRYIVKFAAPSGDYYCEWSTVVDAVTVICKGLEEFTEYYLNEYGEAGMKDLPHRLERVEKYGTSSIAETLTDTIRGNRNGPNESEMTMQQLIDYVEAEYSKG